MCVVHSQCSAGKSFVHFSGCHRPDNRLEKLQDICKSRLSNLSTHQIEWKIHATKCLRTWNQNMGNVETVIGALPKVLTAWRLQQRIQKQFSNLELLGVLPQLLRKWFRNMTASSVIKWGERRWMRKVSGQLKPLLYLNVKAGRQCLKLQKIKGTRSSYGGSEVLISLHVKHVFTAAVESSVRETLLI